MPHASRAITGDAMHGFPLCLPFIPSVFPDTSCTQVLRHSDNLHVDNFICKVICIILINRRNSLLVCSDS